MKDQMKERYDIGSVPFPRYIDKPRLIGVFEMDEFMIFFGTIGVVIFISLATPQVNSLITMISALGTGFGLALGYKKFKKNRPDGYTVQKLYRQGIFSPDDDKRALLKYPYLKKIGRVIPYGFTKELLN